MQPALATLLAAAAFAAAGEPQARRVSADWFACDDGKYAVTLSRHYRSLFTIGRHRVVDLGTVRRGEAVWLKRRIEYIGLTLEVMVPAQAPERYVLTQLDAWSRRWNIGRLSVGQKPWWWWFSEKSLKGVPLQGAVALEGAAGESVTLWLNDGRIDRVSFHCRA